MNNILVLFAHPALERSIMHQSLLDHIRQLANVTINDLYENYPDFEIDVEREKKLLSSHEVIVWQHPFFWYSGPALLKQWQDLVFEYGWAYGKENYALEGKRIFNAITSGGELEAFQKKCFHNSTIRDFLLPFERTAEICRMIYFSPFWVPETEKLGMARMQEFGKQYKDLLMLLRDNDLNDPKFLSAPLLNKLVSTGKPI
jgi:glutathione-regulated potassium-efflux system ancillary protein KefG